MKTIFIVAVMVFCLASIFLVSGAAKPSLDCTGGPFCRETDYTTFTFAALCISALVAGLIVMFSRRGN